MGAICILAPVVIAGWPAFSAAVAAAAGALGYQMASEGPRLDSAAEESVPANAVQLEMERTELVTEQLGRGQNLAVTKDGVTITFSRDARGQASLCVTGDGYETEQLRAMGEEMSRSVIQHYVYQKLQDEMRARGFNVVEEEVCENGAIRLKVRHWE